jgi:hypothetical protein
MTLFEKLWARLGASAENPDISPALAGVSQESAPIDSIRRPCRAVLFTMRRRLAGSLRLAVALGVTLGCEVPTDSDLPSWSANGGTSEPCVAGEVRDCNLTLTVYGEAASCYYGQAKCRGGQWGPCVDGTVGQKRLPGTSEAWGVAPARSLQALTTAPPTDCVNNPCDPRCQVYAEVPTPPLEAEGVPAGASWRTGSLVDLEDSNIPDGFIDKGKNEPCTSADDCQFDHYCQFPSTEAACLHSKCSTGKALVESCDPCVSRVCAADPSCCTTGTTTSCAHTSCEAGAMLDPGCDACVTQVCATHPECCLDPDLAHDFCLTGSKLSLAVGDACVAAVCAENPSCCATSCTHDPCSSSSTAMLAHICSLEVNTICEQRPNCCVDGCSASPYAARSSKLTLGECNDLYDPLIANLCERDPTCCVATGCTFDPCSALGSGSSRMVPGSCTSEPHATAAAETCADNASCCTTSCSHHPCDSGGARLSSGCDQALGGNKVQWVCADRPDCCTSPCPVHPCDVNNGKANLASCDPVVAQVCSLSPTATCCTSKWTTACRDKYRQLKGITNATCDGATWDTECKTAYDSLALPGQSCQSRWSSTCRDLYLGHLEANTGESIDTCQTSYSATCRSEFQSVNGISSTTRQWTSTCRNAYGALGGSCETSWSQACVNRVDSACGIDCSEREWSATCANAVPSTCGETCPRWSASCVDRVDAACGAFCPQTGTCDHDKCLLGGPLANGCDPCVSQICALDPDCCGREWDAYCVVKVGSVCGVNCEQQVEGQCIPWLPNATNPTCEGVDLTVGVPCEEVVPVCNRGKTAAPADIPIYTFPGNSPGMQDPGNSPGMQDPVCAPDLDQKAETCNIPVAIPPGKCVEVSCPGIFDQLREIMVNPANAPGAIAECLCDNNWSVYKKPNPNSGLSCAPPDCAAATTEASVAKVNMMFMYDKSGSMCEPNSSNCTAANTRWGLTAGALRTFLKDQKSAGLRVGLRFFPDTVTVGGVNHDCSGNNCTTYDHCAVPQVALGELLAGTETSYPNNCSTSSDPQECLLVKAINAESPDGYTPTRIALGGAYQYMAEYAAAHPFERSFVVLVTDGEPNHCSSTDPSDPNYYGTVLPRMALDAYRDFGIVTFTVGIDNQGGEALLRNIATQGGGQAFMTSATQTGTSTEFVNALNEIRTQAAACDFVIDPTNPIDPANVRVSYAPQGTGTPQELTRVDGATSCGTGWYFDDPFVPTLVTLCPTTCATVRDDNAAKLSLALGCPMEYHEETESYVYTATCARDQQTQWQHLAYTASTPTTSTVTFQVTTASDSALFTEPPTTPVVDAAVAHGAVGAYTTNTQVCGLGSDCVVSLFGVLGPAAAFDPFLQLRITLRSAPGGNPQLTDWNVTYTCVDSK